MPKKRQIIVLSLILLLWITYRVFAVYTIRRGRGVSNGIWSCVGSTNFDDRSFQLNDEIALGVLDRNIASAQRRAFANDLRQTRQRTFAEWSHRPLWHKLIDQLAYLGGSQL